MLCENRGSSIASLSLSARSLAESGSKTSEFCPCLKNSPCPPPERLTSNAIRQNEIRTCENVSIFLVFARDIRAMRIYETNLSATISTLNMSHNPELPTSSDCQFGDRAGEFFFSSYPRIGRLVAFLIGSLAVQHCRKGFDQEPKVGDNALLVDVFSIHLDLLRERDRGPYRPLALMRQGEAGDLTGASAF
jgi:hypothetical protein